MFTTTPAVSVDWPVRTRNLAGPTSAMSATFTIHDPAGKLPDIVFSGNRSQILTAHTETYRGSGEDPVGKYTLSAVFFSGPNQTGVQVGTAAANVALTADGSFTKPDGTALGTIAFTGVVANVTVTAAQVVHVAQQVQLTVSASDAGNNPLVLSAGSFTWKVAVGTNFITLTADGLATGKLVGTPQVAASVDGVSSAPTLVSVVP